jgi:hypothetical protein
MSPRKRDLLTKTRVPAPELFRGLYLTKQNGDGTLPRYGYLLGRTYVGGRWAFFPVGLLVKTPFAMLLLCGLGVAVALLGWRSAQLEATIVLFAGVSGPLLVGIVGNINIGLRHVLPVYPFLAMFGAMGAMWLWRQHGRYEIAAKVVTFLLMAWCAAACISASPEFLPYFNELASAQPGYFLVDSDLDWGQDYYKLETRLRDIPAEDVWIDYFGDPTILKHESAGWNILDEGASAKSSNWSIPSASTRRPRSMNSLTSTRPRFALWATQDVTAESITRRAR